MLQPMKSRLLSCRLFRSFGSRFLWVIGTVLVFGIAGYIFLEPHQPPAAPKSVWQPLKTAPIDRLQQADDAATPVKHDETPTVVGFVQITSAQPVESSTMASSLVCVENAADVEEISLFMPDMGHGTEPPQIKGPQPLPTDLVGLFANKNAPGCFEVSKMQMYMPGLWELRVLYRGSPQVALAYWSLNQ